MSAGDVGLERGSTGAPQREQASVATLLLSREFLPPPRLSLPICQQGPGKMRS